MNHFVRILLILILPALVAACGGQTVAPAPAVESSSTSVSEAVTPASEPTSAPAATSEPVVSTTVQLLEETETFRLIRHARGETQVPLKPECIVVAGSGYLDHLLTLGVKPCGAASGSGDGIFPDYLADQLAGVEYMGGTLEVNLEKVAVTKPDLILAMYPAHTEGEFATNFEPIAPTVYLTEPWVDWRQALLELGLILGKQAEAKAALANFDARLAEARTELVDAIGAEKVIFLRVLPAELRIYGTASPTGDLLFNRLGLTPSSLVPIGEENSSISMELIPEIDADHIFLLDQTEDGMATLKNSPLWQTIPAVQQGNIYPVEVKIWIQGEGLQAYETLVADVEAALSNSEEAVAKPSVIPEAEPAQSEPGSTAFPVTISHDRGEITLEKPATRIVVFSEEFIELAIALDITPVGVGPWRNEPSGKTFNQLPYLDQPIPGEPVYLKGDQPDLEALLALKPDLIIHHDYADDTNAELYDSFLQIAPTLAYEGSTVGGWKRALTGLAQATGHTDQAEAVIANYDTRVAALQTEMAPVVAVAPKVTVLLSGIDFVGVFDERFAIGSLMKTLGFELTTPLGDEMDASGYSNISPELLGEIEADSVMTLRFDNDKEHLIDPILATLSIPALSIEIRPGMGYTGPFAEPIYLESFAQAFQAHYGELGTANK